MKDVAACEKLRGAGKRALIRRYPNGETHPCIDGFQTVAMLTDERAALSSRCVRRQKHFKSNRSGDLEGQLCRCVVCDDKSRTKSQTSDAGDRRVMYAGVAQAEYIGLVRRTW